MRICLPRRCGLCRFRLDDNDEILIYRNNGDVSNKLRFDLIMFDGDIDYKECCGACAYDESATGCHLECTRFVCSRDVCLALIKATSYQYEPLPTQDRRRGYWLQSRWSWIISNTFTLPLEIGSQIAQYCPRQLAIVYALVLLDLFGTRDSHINISSTIRVRYTVFEGVKYVTSLTNQGCEDNVDAVLLSVPASLSTLYIAEDQLGVRDVLLAAQGNRGRSDVWWHTLEFSSTDSQLSIVNDGIKVRNLRKTKADLPATTLWAVSQPPRTLRWERLQKLYRNLHPLRMCVLQLNRPEISAYSVCFGINIITIHAHIPGENMEFYNSVPTQVIWQYMPVDTDEFITEIWKRQGLENRDIALMFRTNRDRVTVLGVYRKRNRTDCTWTLIDRLTNKPTCIFFNTSTRGIHNLAFETPRAFLQSNARVPTLPEPLSSYPESQRIEDYFYTSAFLDNATTVTPCNGSYKGEAIITGLVLTYSDGHESCVGHIRRDRLGYPFELTASPMLWLGFSLESMEPRVAKMETMSRPSATSSLEWLEVPWTGQLEWWFSARQCKVHHKQKASPATRLAFGSS